MSRRRVAIPTKAISITLKQSLLDRMHTQLAHNHSRSAYIAHAIENQLMAYDRIERIDSKDLLFELMFRGIIKKTMHDVLVETISEDA